MAFCLFVLDTFFPGSSRGYPLPPPPRVKEVAPPFASVVAHADVAVTASGRGRQAVGRGAGDRWRKERRRRGRVDQTDMVAEV